MTLRKIAICIACVCALSTHAQEAMNRPYVDDKLFHFGFQLGMNFSSFGIQDSNEPVMMNGQLDTIHARVSSVLPGFHVGFVTDLRLCNYLNLRFCPGLQFSSRIISYQAASGRDIRGLNESDKNKVEILAIPVYLPLYLKFSAKREGNYRPYVIGGGGASFNVSRDRDKPVLMNLTDYFCEVGFGCDFYLNWFKFCPEITYRIGFANQLCPSDQHPNLDPKNVFYTDAISRMTSHCICITFNFE